MTKVSVHQSVTVTLDLHEVDVLLTALRVGAANHKKYQISSQQGSNCFIDLHDAFIKVLQKDLGIPAVPYIEHIIADSESGTK
jgi:hypothetical protein